MARSASRHHASARDAAARDLKFQALAGDLRRGILAGDWAPGSKLPTESQLAKDTGLSLTTVRRAFDELVQQGLVDRRQGAGSFVRSREVRTRAPRRRVGVLVPSAQQYYPRVLAGIEEALSSAGAGMQLSTYHYDEAEEHRDLQFLLESDIDGLLVVPTLVGLADPQARVDELMALPVPTVLVERHVIDGGAADRSEYVCSDHAGGAYDAVRHLHRLDHTRISLVARSANPTIEWVTIGFEAAVSDLGLERQEHLTAPKPQWSDEMASDMVERLVAAGSTAALVFGDREATLIARAVGQRGLQVPGDLALVSYDDETADLAEVPLTAVAPPKFRVGRMAAEVLLRRLTEGDACPIHQVKLRPRIVIRASCGARTADLEL
ncbi:MAG: substrate-binding domain-containing protein [Humibacillus sp.]|nr:substrate-binding domain-containing protein [Humibacillus sp.]MDN5775451.1 substrate-binding domain-containing protein [Humibacillus sp.]